MRQISARRGRYAEKSPSTSSSFTRPTGGQLVVSFVSVRPKDSRGAMRAYLRARRTI